MVSYRKLIHITEIDPDEYVVDCPEEVWRFAPEEICVHCKYFYGYVNSILDEEKVIVCTYDKK